MRRSISTLLLLFAIKILAHTTPLPAVDFGSSISDSYISRIRAAELEGDRETVAAQCRDWYASGQYSSGALNWNYNALMSLEQDAVLITQNDNDTYPVWLLQYALNVRTDVRVLNLGFLEDGSYRDRMIRQERLDFSPAGSSLADFLRGCVSGKTNLPVYFGVMLDKNRLEVAKSNLYLTGLAMKYSQRPFDNVAVLRNNYENRFRLDYLKLELAQEADPTMLAQLNLNYLPAFLVLYRHYAGAGEQEKAAQLRELILRIGRAGNREMEVMAFFDNGGIAPRIVTDITPKALEKPMKKVNNRLWAAETETTNAQYDRFLQDLLKNRDFEQLEKCKTTATNWRSLLPDSLKNLPEGSLFPNGHPDEPEMPIQNISHEAAERYCAWMTQVYNASTDRKKYKKVVFRLPNESEWMEAAGGGIQKAPYPWGGFYVRNSKGCYLLNIKAEEPCGDCPGKTPYASDGGIFPVRADAYFPNNFGLYNVSGNVAEMIQEPGKCKGGSWNDIPYYGQLPTVGAFTAPSPTVGFRVFMEVIEE